MSWKQLSSSEKMNIWQIIFAAIGIGAAIVTALLAYDIGVKQNEINELALRMNNFVELYLQPQRYDYRDANGQSAIAWNILIQNVSTYPVYLNAYTIDDQREAIGANALPNNSDAWFTIPLMKTLEAKGTVPILIEFEDYLGMHYQVKGSAMWKNDRWSIRAEKREEIK